MAGGMFSTSPANAPSGIDATHWKMMSAIIKNFVSPPPRRIPFDRALCTAWKKTMTALASIICTVISTVERAISYSPMDHSPKNSTKMPPNIPMTTDRIRNVQPSF